MPKKQNKTKAPNDLWIVVSTDIETDANLCTSEVEARGIAREETLITGTAHYVGKVIFSYATANEVKETKH